MPAPSGEDGFTHAVFHPASSYVPAVASRRCGRLCWGIAGVGVSGAQCSLVSPCLQSWLSHHRELSGCSGVIRFWQSRAGCP